MCGPCKLYRERKVREREENLTSKVGVVKTKVEITFSVEFLPRYLELKVRVIKIRRRRRLI